MSSSGRVRVSDGPRRCPFCHDDVIGAECIVCAECLARHHTECWREANRCSTCRKAVALVPESKVPKTTKPSWVKVDLVSPPPKTKSSGFVASMLIATAILMACPVSTPLGIAMASFTLMAGFFSSFKSGAKAS